MDIAYQYPGTKECYDDLFFCFAEYVHNLKTNNINFSITDITHYTSLEDSVRELFEKAVSITVNGYVDEAYSIIMECEISILITRTTSKELIMQYHLIHNIFLALRKNDIGRVFTYFRTFCSNDVAHNLLNKL